MIAYDYDQLEAAKQSRGYGQRALGGYYGRRATQPRKLRAA